MSADYEKGELLPDGLLETAGAIAARNGQFAELVERINASLNGTEYVPTSDAIRKAQLIGQTTMNLLRVASPNAPVSIEEMVGAVADDATVQAMIDQINADNENTSWHIGVDNIREAQVGIISELFNSAGSDNDKRASDFERFYKAACTVAKKYGVSVTEVYADDDLYYESWRMDDTPEGYAKEVTKLIEATCSNTWKAGIVRTIEQVLPKELLEDLSPEELDELVAELQLDKDLAAKLEEDLEPVREAMRQTFTYLFLQIYGYDNLAQLDPEVRDGFAPRRAWVKEVFGNSMTK